MALPQEQGRPAARRPAKPRAAGGQRPARPRPQRPRPTQPTQPNLAPFRQWQGGGGEQVQMQIPSNLGQPGLRPTATPPPAPPQGGGEINPWAQLQAGGAAPAPDFSRPLPTPGVQRLTLPQGQGGFQNPGTAPKPLMPQPAQPTLPKLGGGGSAGGLRTWGTGNLF